MGNMKDLIGMMPGAGKMMKMMQGGGGKRMMQMMKNAPK
jgi:hypothetical protein